MPVFVEAEVRDIMDPMKSGRVKIRQYKRQDNEQLVKDEQLAWAIPLMPPTAASTAKLGSSPVGLRVGSRVMVMYQDDDPSQQYPIILGAFQRAGSPKSKGGTTDTNTSQADVQLKDSDNPGSFKYPNELNKLEHAPQKTYYNKRLGGKEYDPSKEAHKFNQEPYQDHDEGKSAFAEARKLTNEEEGDKPRGVASGDPDKKTIKTILDQTDPQRISQILPQMYNQFEKIKQIISSPATMSASFGGGGGGGASAAPSVSSAVKNQVQDALTGALIILTKKYGYAVVLASFTALFVRETFNNVLPEFKPIVYGAFVNLVKLINEYGEKNIPLLTPPPVVLGEKIPFPIVTSIPDFYVQEFYPSDVDPYPGYIQWQGMNGDYIYTLRTQTDYPFATSDDAVIHAAQVGLARELEPYILAPLTFTVAILNSLLTKYCLQVQDQNMTNTMGKNSSSNLAGLLGQLLPMLQSAISKSQSDHLPKSVLDQGKINTLHKNKQKKQAENKQVQKLANEAIKTPEDIKAEAPAPAEKFNAGEGPLSTLPPLVSA